MAITLLQNNQKAAGGVTSTTLSLTSTTNTTSMLACYVFQATTSTTAAVFTVSDNVNGSYNKDAQVFRSAAWTHALFTFPNITSGTTTLTITSNGGGQLYVMVEEWSGLSATPLDQTVTKLGSGVTTAPNVGPSSATTSPNELVLASFGAGNGGQTFTAGTGYTLGTQHASKIVSEYQVVSSTGTQTATGTYSTGDNFTGLLATYVAAGPATLTAAKGTFVLSGEAATLSTSTGAFSLTLATGTFTLTGEPVTLATAANFSLVAQPGSFDLVGGLGTSDLQLEAAADANSQFVLSSAPVVFSGSFGTAFSLNTAVGLFAYTGGAVTLSLSVQFTIQPFPGAFILVGETITGALAGGICNVIPNPAIVINLEIVTEAFQKIGVVDELESPSAEQGANGLRILNDFLLNQAADGLRLGWFKQTDLSAIAPLRQEDIFGVKLLLAKQLAAHYGITIQDPVLLSNMADAERQLVKRSLRYFESDFSEWPRPQGGPWGGPNWL